jgi:hypothetical protein
VSHAPSADATQHPPPCRLDPPAVSQSATADTGAGGHVQSQSSQHQQPQAHALTTVAPVAPSASAETTQHPPQSPLASPTDQTADSQSTADTGAGGHVHSQSSQQQQHQAAQTTPVPVAGDLRGTKRKLEEAGNTKLFGAEIGTSEFLHFPSNVLSTCATRPRYWPAHWDSLAHPAGLTAARRMLSADNLEQAKRSYKRMALVMHPDKNLDDTEGAGKAFGALKAAYEIISNYEALNEDNEDNEDVSCNEHDVKQRVVDDVFSSAKV